MDPLLFILDCIEELLREFMLAEARGATEELNGFDAIYRLIHSCCELILHVTRGGRTATPSKGD